MKIAYFDCFSGISGDMVLGALIDLGLPLEKLREELQKIPLPFYTIETLREKRHEVSGIKVNIAVKNSKGLSFSFKEIMGLIENSSLSAGVKAISRRIFRRVAEAEALVHGKTIDDIHFHEIGAIDSIIDIVGASIGIEYLTVDEIFSSPLPFTRGFIHCQHGILPSPGPATLEMLRGVPLYGMDIEKEIVTPTGAAIISTLSKGFSAMPLLRLEKVGYGVGSFHLKEIPNLLRIILGEPEVTSCEEERAVVLEANIDDMNPEYYDYLIERLFEKGALDVSLSSLQMKKNRPGVLLRVITSPDKLGELRNVLFKDSTTTGFRYHEVKRIKLKRRIEQVETPYGTIRVKVVEGIGGKAFLHPEYDDLKRIASEQGMSLREAEQSLQAKLADIHYQE